MTKEEELFITIILTYLVRKGGSK